MSAKSMEGVLRDIDIDSARLAAQSYKEGKFTLSEAAGRAGMTIWDFEHFLVDKGFKSQYSVEDLRAEAKLLAKRA